MTRNAADRVALDHLVDGEVLADVAQELEQADPAQPVEVIDHVTGPARSLVVGEEVLDLSREPAGVLRQLVRRQQVALAALARRIPDHPGRAAHQGEQPVSVPSHVAHRHERHQITGMKTGGRGVEPGVDCQRVGEHLAETLRGGLLNEPAPGQLFERAHGESLTNTAEGSRQERVTQSNFPRAMATQANPAANRGPDVEVADDSAAWSCWRPPRSRDLASAAIAARGRFRVALAGGSTPRALYPRLVAARSTGRTRTSSSATSARSLRTTRSRTTGWRARRCSTPARVSAKNVHRWLGEADDLDAAARVYELALGGGGAPGSRAPGARRRRAHGVALPRHDGAGRGGRLASRSTSPRSGRGA